MLTKRLVLLSLFFCGCSTSINHWQVDDITAGDQSFNVSRIRFASSQDHPSLVFEILKIGNEMNAFLRLTRFRFSTEIAKVSFTIGNETFEESIPVHEGGMRLRLSSETTQLITRALQEGQKVDIVLDGFEETLTPEQFSSAFTEFVNEAHFFQTLFKGPLK